MSDDKLINSKLILDLLVGRRVSEVDYDGKILKIRIPEGVIHLCPTYRNSEYLGHTAIFQEDLQISMKPVEKLVYAENSPDRQKT